MKIRLNGQIENTKRYFNSSFSDRHNRLFLAFSCVVKSCTFIIGEKIELSRKEPVTVRQFLLALMLVCGLCSLSGSAFAEDSHISGEIVGGLRLITIQPGAENHFVVYRGDYVQPHLVGSDRFEIDIPGLRQVKAFPAEEGDKAYVKMTISGEFAFTAGDARGIFEVVEYSAPSYQAVSSDEAAQILANTSPFILDVRTRSEYHHGHIEGAHLVPVQVLQSEMPELEPYKDRDVFIYCASGNRSTVAARLLIENGFKKIYNLRYGIGDWQKKGYPVVR